MASFPLPHGAEPDDSEGEAVEQAADALKQALNAMQDCGGRAGPVKANAPQGEECGTLGGIAPPA